MTKEEAIDLVKKANQFINNNVTIPGSTETWTFSRCSNMVGMGENSTPMNFSVTGILTNEAGGTQQVSLQQLIDYFERKPR